MKFDNKGLNLLICFSGFIAEIFLMLICKFVVVIQLLLGKELQLFVGSMT